jgi:hypothetical protein
MNQMNRGIKLNITMNINEFESRSDCDMLGKSSFMMNSH